MIHFGRVWPLPSLPSSSDNYGQTLVNRAYEWTRILQKIYKDISLTTRFLTRLEWWVRHEGATTGGPTPFNHHHFRSGLQLIPHPGSHGDPSPTPSAEVSLVKGLVSLHPPVVSHLSASARFDRSLRGVENIIRDFHYYIHYIYYLSFGDWGWTMPFQSFSIFWRFHLRITYVGPTGKNKSVMAYISIILNLNSWFSSRQHS